MALNNRFHQEHAYLGHFFEGSLTNGTFEKGHLAKIQESKNVTLRIFSAN